MEQISWWRIKFGDAEIAKITQAVQREQISQGPIAEEFESKFASMLKVKHAISTTSGSTALYLTLFAMGVGPGDEVIIPDRTWIATAHAAYMLGAKVVLVDTLSNTPVINVDHVEKCITKKTKVIMPVHVNGRACDLERLKALAQKHNIKIVEDAAQAMFSKSNGCYLGTTSDAGCFSFAMSKLISTGQGGMVVTNDNTLAKKLKLIKNHGVIDNFTDTWNQPGINFKFTDILASIGLVQLDRVSKHIDHMMAIYEMYEQGLKDCQGIKLCPVAVDKGEHPLWVEATCQERDRLISFLRERNIQSRPSSPPLHTSDYFKSDGVYPNATYFAQKNLILPCGPDQPLVNVEKVISAVKEHELSLSTV